MCELSSELLNMFTCRLKSCLLILFEEKYERTAWINKYRATENFCHFKSQYTDTLYMVALPLLSCFGMFSKVGSRCFVEDLYQALFLFCLARWNGIYKAKRKLSLISSKIKGEGVDKGTLWWKKLPPQSDILSWWVANTCFWDELSKPRSRVLSQICVDNVM